MLTLQGVTYIHPTGDRLFSDLDLSVNKNTKIALIGNNGVGKSTLLKIIAGETLPSGGTVTFESSRYYVPQVTGQFNHLTVAEALRIDTKLSALKEILNGHVSESNLNIVGNDWTLDDRCQLAFVRWGLRGIMLEQKLDTLSGGQKTKVFLSGIAIHEPDLVLLDEPTNHLDSDSRDLVYDYLTSAKESVVVVSHDRRLLNGVESVYELSSKGLKMYGGNYAFYELQKEIENNSLREDLKSKEKALRKAKEVERETTQRKQKLDARGKKKQEKAGIPTIIMNTLRNKAEKSTARLTDIHVEKVNGIQQDIKNLRSEIPSHEKIKMNLDDSALHKGKTLVSAVDVNFAFDGDLLWKSGLSFEIRSAERVGIRGGNGSGKTTLLNGIMRKLSPAKGRLDVVHVSCLYIDQDYSLIRNNRSVYELAQEFNSESMPEHEVKIRLNRFLFAKDDWEKPAAVLSGGEKMRLLLCLLTVSLKAPDVIILDEPTNNLDLESIEILTAALNQYRGTLIVVSHDQLFLNDIGVERFITL